MMLPPSLDGVPLRERRVSVQGVSLRVVEAGPDEGPLVLLLHGFPEFWYGWRRQIPALVRAGYRVWAPDQRGYGASGKPVEVGAYRLETLALDVVGLIEQAGVERAHAVVGHDWGAAVAWWVGIAHPDSIERLVVLNVPHPSRSVMKAALRKRPGQLLRSWYIFAVQLPWIPERLLGWQRGRLLAANLRGKDASSFSSDDRERYREAWAQSRALTGMLNWYRAMLRHPPRAPGSNRVTVPTLILWGERDRYLVKELAPLSLAKCDRGRLVTFPDATHWLQHDEAEGVNRALVEFLGEGVDMPGPAHPVSTFREATRADLPSMVRLLAHDPLGTLREAPGEQVSPAYEAAFQAIAADPNHQLLVVEVDGRMAGFLQLSFLPHLTYEGGVRAQIEGVRVDEMVRSQGVGEALFHEAIRRARERGCHLVQLTTDLRRPDALRFYERLGFQATHHGMKLHLDRGPSDQSGA